MHKYPIAAIALTLMLGATAGPSEVRAFDESIYPNWKGQWMRGEGRGPRYDPDKPPGPNKPAAVRAPIRPIPVSRPACLGS
jgi:hypothetical protein